MAAYYNEIDPKVAEWLRNLIAARLIAPGDVDNRSIEDVRPDDLRGYTQCHFFAGIGVWSYALRRAGWRDDEPVWTGSCPCQPFSAAGKGGGFDDERHLWPAWEWLIARAKPRGVPVFGEQVASKAGLAWLDIVSADLEGQGYTVRATDLCAAGVGAPHIRQRLFFVADTDGGQRGRGPIAAERNECNGQDAGPSVACGVGVSDGGDATQERQGDAIVGKQRPEERRREQQHPRFRTASGVGGRDSTNGTARVGDGADQDAPRPTNGFWRDADWLPCIDGKARPVEPGTFPLAHGATGRVVRLRAYGNAIVAPLAEEFIRAYADVVALSELL